MDLAREALSRASGARVAYPDCRMTVAKTSDARFPIALWLLVAGVAVLYGPILRDLASDWDSTIATTRMAS